MILYDIILYYLILSYIILYYLILYYIISYYIILYYGSTWLTALIESAGGCGSPGEFFNPRLMRQTASLVGAQNLQDYIHLVTRRSGIDGVFGCEVTSGHLHAVFRDDREFLDLLRPTASLFLIREDIVAQAVSASRLEQTGVAHKIGDFTEGRVEPNFRYSHRQIHNYLGRLLFMEKQLEGFFQRQNTKPLRMSYERLTSKVRRILFSGSHHI